MVRAKKYFGQHFLHDQYVIKKILQSFDAKADDNVVEIGPGMGALTAQLVNQPFKSLQLIEIDADMVNHLQPMIAEHDHIKIHHMDALDVDLSELGSVSSPIRLIGNLPYNISTPLLFHFCRYQTLIHDMLFMMQKEVIDRITAAPGNKIYGRLNVSLGLRFESQKLFNVAPGSFNPPPKVDSSIVRLIPRKTHGLTVQIDDFDLLVKTAFSQRRKTLRKALIKLVDADTFIKADIDPGLRAERLSLEDFIHLANCHFGND